MGTKHTSGEWKVSKEPFTLLVTHQITEKRVRTICQISLMNKSPEETLANAKLIACAPMLLDTLAKIRKEGLDLLEKLTVDEKYTIDEKFSLLFKYLGASTEVSEVAIKKATN